MIIETWWSNKIAQGRLKEFQEFIQQMANRMIQGEARYGKPKKEQNYMTRLMTEAHAYKNTGNHEQLINIANYCVLESICPENKKYHFDPSVDSVTRRK